MKNLKITIVLLAIFIVVPEMTVFGQDSDTPKKYDKVSAYKEDGFALVQLGSKVGLIDKSGKEVVPCKYDRINGTTIIYNNAYLSVYFVDGFVGVLLDGKWGYVAQDGNEITPMKYDEIRPFCDSMASVVYDRKRGYIDTSGKEVIPCRYDGAGDFDNGIASVQTGNKWIYIDKQGNEYATKKAAQKTVQKK